jgi:hypothetical protein
MIRFATSCLALAISAATAWAGPLPTWDYNYSFSGERGSSFVDAGIGARQDSNSSTGFRYYQGYVQLTPAIPSPNPTASGNQTITLGSTPGYSQFYWAADADHAPPATPVNDAPIPGGKLDARLEASITIKDISSGLDHTVSLTRNLAQGSGDPYLGTPVTFVGAGEDLGEAFDLGSNRYQVKFRQAVGPDGPNLTGKTQLLVAEVTVTSTVETPEPTTLALGGIGLAGVFGAKLRRRRTITG